MLKPFRWLLRLTITLTIGVVLAYETYTHMQVIAGTLPGDAPSDQSFAQAMWGVVGVISEQIKHLIGFS